MMGLSEFEAEIVRKALAGEPLSQEERGLLVPLGRLLGKKREHVNKQMEALIARLDGESEMASEFRADLAEFNESVAAVENAIAAVTAREEEHDESDGTAA